MEKITRPSRSKRAHTCNTAGPQGNTKRRKKEASKPGPQGNTKRRKKEASKPAKNRSSKAETVIKDQAEPVVEHQVDPVPEEDHWAQCGVCEKWRRTAKEVDVDFWECKMGWLDHPPAQQGDAAASSADVSEVSPGSALRAELCPFFEVPEEPWGETVMLESMLGGDWWGDAYVEAARSLLGQRLDFYSPMDDVRPDNAHTPALNPYRSAQLHHS